MRWSDMDAYGHVNNVVYLTYLEEARVDARLKSRTLEGNLELISRETELLGIEPASIEGETAGEVFDRIHPSFSDPSGAAAAWWGSLTHPDSAGRRSIPEAP